MSAVTLNTNPQRDHGVYASEKELQPFSKKAVLDEDSTIQAITRNTILSKAQNITLAPYLSSISPNAGCSIREWVERKDHLSKVATHLKNLLLDAQHLIATVIYTQMKDGNTSSDITDRINSIISKNISIRLYAENELLDHAFGDEYKKEWTAKYNVDEKFSKNIYLVFYRNDKLLELQRRGWINLLQQKSEYEIASLTDRACEILILRLDILSQKPTKPEPATFPNSSSRCIIS
ncbi:MAG: hypothetical protein WAM28_00930 [Chlamydiales bacterium]